MSEVQLLQGDCLDQLKTLDNNSIDSIVTDPPYGLSFMGKAWDHSVPSTEVWAECLRVLKPGGHLLAFAGTRTQHRMAVNIEDAGFEIRDMIAWVYGCLSEDTNIVTPEGEKSYTTIKTGDLVLCYDKYSKEYSYQPVEGVYEYDIKDTAYRIQSNFTDQIVSRNHRCLVERGGREVFLFAEELETQENIPFLEDLPSLQNAISDTNQRTGNKEQSLFQRMFQSFNWNEKFWGQTDRNSTWNKPSRLFSLWKDFLSKQKTLGTSKKTSVFSEMQWEVAGRGMEEPRSQGPQELESRVRESIGATNDRRHQPKLEGWGDLQTPKGELQRSEVCSMPRQLFEYVKERWVCNGTSFGDGNGYRETLASNRSGSSCQSRLARQQNRESYAVQNEQRPQVVREWSGHKTTLATVKPFEYEGKIWCVKVPTGSFVAVRNGQAFTTGNSGFPKSQNVSKAIDKAAGAERTEVRGVKAGHESFAGRGTSGVKRDEGSQGGEGGFHRPWMDDAAKANAYHLDTAPATDEAKQWDGWGTALKPALEPITVARKPLSGTVAANVLEHGTGAINIDGCRVDFQNEADKASAKPQGRATAKSENLAGKEQDGFIIAGPIQDGERLYWSNQIGWVSKNNADVFYDTKIDDPIESTGREPATERSEFEVNQGTGRFPANLIHDGSDEVLPCFPNTEPSRKGKPRGSKTSGDGWGMTKTGSEYDDQGTAARFFYCAKANKKDRNEGLESVDPKSSASKGNGLQRVCSKCGISQRGDEVCQDEDNCPKEWVNPPKKNNHPTVKPTDLMQYLVRLVTPPNGTVLDPFMGSGSTGKACMIEGFDFIGIELDEEYYKIAHKRIESVKSDNTLNKFIDWE